MSIAPEEASALPERVRDADHLRRYWDKHASEYDRGIAFFERVLFGDGRQWACGQACGDVLEVAIGTGRNLDFYPRDVRLNGVEFSPAMLEIARQHAQELGLPVDLQLGDAHALQFADSSFDTVVSTLSLCSIADDRRALAEMHRVLRPGGRLILLDHVIAEQVWAQALQWLLDGVTMRFAGGDHLLRRPLMLLPALGFEVESSQRSKLGIVERVIARKPLNAASADGGRHSW